jgi:2-amino-4-hydroxy-6-hydroxymethyldihydropteridine diphosphokinase
VPFTLADEPAHRQPLAGRSGTEQDLAHLYSFRMPQVRAYIGLGANVGDSQATLTAAVHSLAALPEAVLSGVSRLYVTTPVEVTDQPDFHNAVVGLDVPTGPGSDAGPIALLLALKSLERAFGRVERPRFGPRELDLDLLLFGDVYLSIERPEAGRSPDPAKAWHLLDVPHARAHERLFVLAPLSDLAPDVVPPGWCETVASARDRRTLIEGATAVRAIGRWELSSGRWVGLE